MLDELLTTCLDTVSGDLVSSPADLLDPETERLRHRCHPGNRTLICALCAAGIDAQPGSHVPVLLRPRAGGRGRPHFAHPAGRAPRCGQHSPQATNLLAARAMVEAWASAQPPVTSVGRERGAARLSTAEVSVHLAGSAEVILTLATMGDAGYVRVSCTQPCGGPQLALNLSTRTVRSLNPGGPWEGVLEDLSLTTAGLVLPAAAPQAAPAAHDRSWPAPPAPAAVDSGALRAPRRDGTEYFGMTFDARVCLPDLADDWDDARIRLAYKALALFEECCVMELADEFGDPCGGLLADLDRCGYIERFDRQGFEKIRRTERGRRAGRQILGHPR